MIIPSNSIAWLILPGGGALTVADKREFFISRAGADKDVALVINAILRDAGYETFIQDHDFGHTSFMARMTEGFAKV